MESKITAILAIGLILVSLFSVYTLTKEKERNTITVSGSSNLDVVPDQAELYLRIQKTSNDPKEAQAELSKVSNAVIEILKSNGLADKEIETTNYNLEKWQEWENEKMIDKGYKASHTLKLTIKDISKVGNFLDLAVNNGVNNVDSLRFSLSKEKEKEVKSGLLGTATINAKAKADILSQSLNKKIKDVISITESSDSYIPYYYAESASLKSAPVIQPNSISLTVSVTAVFELN